MTNEIHERYTYFLHVTGDPISAAVLVEAWARAEIEERKRATLNRIADKLGFIGDCLGSPEMGYALGNIASISIPDAIRVEMLREDALDKDA